MSSPSSIRTHFARVEAVHDRMERLLAMPDDRLARKADSVSAWSVAQQLVHTALAATTMLIAIDRIVHQAKPAAPSGSITAAGRMVLFAGRFPRGRAQAPERTVPGENPGRIEVTEAIARSRAALARVKGDLPRIADAEWKSQHPVFGWLTAEQWMKAICIHSEHHFSIIDDILSA